MAPEVTTPSTYSTQVEPRSLHREATVCSTTSMNHKNEKELNWTVQLVLHFTSQILLSRPLEAPLL